MRDANAIPGNRARAGYTPTGSASHPRAARFSTNELSIRWTTEKHGKKHGNRKASARSSGTYLRESRRFLLGLVDVRGILDLGHRGHGSRDSRFDALRRRRIESGSVV